MSELNSAGGFKCPECGARRDRVVDSRGNQAGTFIRRRRICDGCRHRWTTYERIEADGDADLFNEQHSRAKAIAAELREMATALERW